MDKFTFLTQENMEPLKIVVEGASYIQEPVKVLDFGIGSGRNSIFLAKRGLEVDGCDVSEKGIEELREVVEKEKLPMSLRVMDFAQEIPPFDQYGFVVATFILHYFVHSRGEEMLHHMTADASAGAIHVLAAMTTEGDFFQNPKYSNNYYPKPGELKKIYEEAGWSIKSYTEKIRQAGQRRPDGTPMENLTAFLIAVKKR